MNQQQLGQVGEELAAKHLINSGYEILEKNYSWKKGELDLICEKDELLVIVEVKTRQTAIFGQPYEAVSRKKQLQIIKVANTFITQRNIDLEVRFDVVSIVINSHRKSIEHIENAFIPLV